MVDISVVIPCYNASEYLGKCLESLSHQSFKNFEIIIVDDCSIDNSISLAEKLVKEYRIEVRIIKNEKNMGPSYSRKNGIAIAAGEYIAFCDSDDYYDITYLEKMFLATENRRHDVVFCDYNAVYSNGVIKKHENVKRMMQYDRVSLIGQASDSLCCMLVRKTLLSGLEFPNIRNGEDMAIIPVILSESNSVGYMEACIYNYVYRENSLSKKFTSEMIDSLKNSFLYIQKTMSNEYHDEIEFLGIKNYLYASVLNYMKNKQMPSKKDITEVVSWFTSEYPNWYKNKYFHSLPRYKKIYLSAVRHRLYGICRLLSMIHKYISK
ncbi:glycosyltransferase family 2 protein [Ruminococcus sp.]|uniref:glycosyltransferase family 2 protein n=1 Tax=Ruminococcus sp. TaxID=41978 RepID=UPI002639825F|nr:glycosyltransferase family 2 protein [Ruminococcus sp.]MDD7556868.1 glycosyltransferase family 2 protein [Ruminococcus sp.]